MYFLTGVIISIVIAVISAIVAFKNKEAVKRYLKSEFIDSDDAGMLAVLTILALLIIAAGWIVVVPILIITVPIMYFYYKLLK